MRRPTSYRSSSKHPERKTSEDSLRVVNLKGPHSKHYPSNKVVTSKYTLWNFMPKNLFEQFRRIANFYFLCMATISSIIESPVSPATSVVPLVFVITVTAVKQGYEDYLRHRADSEVNHTPIYVVRKGILQTVPSKNIQVGDLVKVVKDQDVPCDLVMLYSSHPESKCFVTTANLDGETNLKTLQTPRSLKRTCKTEEDLNNLEATIKCENPNPNLYKFYGIIEFSQKTSTALKFPEQSTFPPDDKGKNNRIIKSKNKQLDKQKKSGKNELKEIEEMGSKTLLEAQTSLELIKQSKISKAKRTESFPRASSKTHKKTFSNVDRISFNLDESPPPLPKVKQWSYEEKTSMILKRNPSLLPDNRSSFTSPEGNVVDPLSVENLLLKGSKLKSIAYVYGCAVYTGPETKLALNSKLTSNKFSTVEKSINKYLLFYLGLLIITVAVSTTLKSVKESKNGYETKAPFANDIYLVTFGTVIEDIFAFIALYNYVIPISLYVTIEMQKFLGTLFFAFDLHMYNEETKESALSNTSDLNEDLGQVQYLFTDKTGTITKNEMKFAKCSVNGTIYEEKDGLLYPVPPKNEKPDWDSPVALKKCSKEMELFLCACALCHTVQVTEGENYSATSPDEKALVEAMKKLDIVFQNDDDEVVVLKILGQCKFFKKLDILEFSSDRKRMSVIIQDEEENIILYCKGAESSVIPQVIDGPKGLTLLHVADFATQRLRTLVVCYKFLTPQEYDEISETLRQSRQTLSIEREVIIQKAYQKIESGLIVLGATGIKDDIQEEVPETLKKLKEAGIKIWMLTGDKLETAENISLDCGHFEEKFVRLKLIEEKSPSSCGEILHRYLSKIEKHPEEQFGLIVDGESLTTALTYHKNLFRNVCVRCEGVICSRMSPLQKKEVVKLIKDQKPQPITAAIGDGANDVSMIQEAHIGLGIMGKEGRQAVRCSDFAFSKFKCLQRAFLVHGHWYYLRVATLVQYFFYKNIAFVLPQFYFLFFSGYSVQNLYDGLYLTGFNTVFTAVPVLIYGLFEQDYSAKVLQKNPALYLVHKENKLLRYPTFLQWFLLGIWHSLVIFFFPYFYFTISPSVLSGSREVNLETLGTLVFHCSVTIVTLKLLLHSRFWSGIFVASVVLSLMFLASFSICYSLIYMENLTSNNYWVYLNLIFSPSFWLLCILICLASLIPDFTMYVYLNRKKRNLS